MPSTPHRNWEQISRRPLPTQNPSPGMTGPKVRGKTRNLPTTAQTRRQRRPGPYLPPIGPLRVEAPLSSGFSLDETSSTEYPRPNAITLSASEQSRGNTSPCSRTIGRIYVRPHSRYITGSRLPHLHSRGACPISVGYETMRTGYALTPTQGGSVSLPALPAGFSTPFMSRPSPTGH